MDNVLLKNIFRFLVLIPIQVLVLNQINFGGYINPFVYVLIILLMPFNIPGWILLLSAFFTGLTIDMFSNSLGMHTAATVFLAFLRPTVIRMISIKKEFEPGTEPTISEMGSGWIIPYTLILVFSHHLVLFLLEVFRFAEFAHTLSRALASTLFTFVLIMIVHYLSGKTRKPRRL